jgi:hypothetical protein
MHNAHFPLNPERNYYAISGLFLSTISLWNAENIGERLLFITAPQWAQEQRLFSFRLIITSIYRDAKLKIRRFWDTICLSVMFSVWTATAFFISIN